ncbi:amidase [Amycolatopsis sp. DSM 110486]|uniref:amidase n=1 Tax=Amycolatopsis sp. DSM 110486 TaxID=2865832 RepID=UPI001C6A890D|nr:amidase [Amycolatopsis sp. DSM 110486]QYN21462.1 amidase [Amycolatopsis sp. DSM 110486]
MSTELTRSDATELAELIRTKKVSSVEVVQAHLDRIEATNPKVNAIVTVAEGALEAAKAADEELASGVEVGPLHGVPFTVKDSFDTAGVLTQRGSPIFAGRVPDTDATAVARLKNTGGILLAKTNLPEFSYAVDSDNLLTGDTNNPWDLGRTAGGSSGGESGAIAAGMSPLGLGSDLAISVRGPAALTGIAALKPTHGRIPMTGAWPREPRRDWHAGPMARTIRDLALAYSFLAGPDGADGFSSTVPAGLDAGLGSSPQRTVRVGWLVDSGLGPVHPEVAATVQAAAEALRGAGVHVDAVSIPALERDTPLELFNLQHVMEVKPAYAEATAGHADQMYTATKFMRDAPETSIQDYVHAEQGVERLRDGFAAYFQQYDALLLPVTTVPAHKHGTTELTLDGKTLSIFHVMSTTAPFNLTGLPALSMRFGTTTEGLPIGVQLAASWHAESTILHIASLLETLSPVRGLHPVL